LVKASCADSGGCGHCCKDRRNGPQRIRG
jgi:hypothetical protein